MPVTVSKYKSGQLDDLNPCQANLLDLRVRGACHRRLVCSRGVAASQDSCEKSIGVQDAPRRSRYKSEAPFH